MRKKTVLWTLLTLVLLVTLGLPGTSTRADDPPPEPICGDDGQWEVGVEYVNWYPWPTPDLALTDDDALSLYNVLGWGGWTRRFAYGNRWAWEEDWKVRWRGGTEHNYVDQVDLAYFSGHGGQCWDSYYGRNLYGPIFGDGGNSHDDPCLVPGDARRAYGNGDLEWVAFSACQTLNDQSRRYWAASMRGLHLLLGFATNMWDVNQGWYFGWYIRWGWTIPQAWFVATDITHPQYAAKARVLANERCHYYHDRWGSVCADSFDWDYWYADHWAGSEPALQVDPADLDYEMPVLNVISPAPTEDDLDRLASAFGFSPATPAVLDDESDFYRITEEQLDLTVDQQGMFYFIDRDRLWSSPTETLSLGAQSLTPQDVRQIADDFLTGNGLMPADAQFYEVVSDTLSGATIQEVPSTTVTARNAFRVGPTETFTDVLETISYTVATAEQAVYSRHIVYTPTHGSPVTFSVQGPGARLKAYVDQEGNVIGAMGGWRTVDALGVLDTVQIITPDQMVALYEQLGDLVSLAPIPFQTDVSTVTRSTVGYYEQSMGVEQSTLTPVYILDVSLRDPSGGDDLASTAFVPAAPSLMNPLAAITTYTGTEPIIEAGEVLHLAAADAAQPLSALGYGDTLNFVLGQGPYTYTWRLETTGKVIGHGLSVNYTAGIEDDLGVFKDNDVPLSIVLEVTDAAGHTSSTVRHFYFADVIPVQRVYLPTVLRR